MGIPLALPWALTLRLVASHASSDIDMLRDIGVKHYAFIFRRYQMAISRFSFLSGFSQLVAGLFHVFDFSAFWRYFV